MRSAGLLIVAGVLCWFVLLAFGFAISCGLRFVFAVGVCLRGGRCGLVLWFDFGVRRVCCLLIGRLRAALPDWFLYCCGIWLFTLVACWFVDCLWLLRVAGCKFDIVMCCCY